MSHNGPESNPSSNETYTNRQTQSSFQSGTNLHSQQTQQMHNQYQYSHVIQPSMYYSNQGVPPLPLNTNMSGIPVYNPHPQYEFLPQGAMYNGYPPTRTIVPQEQPSSVTMRSDAPSFTPSNANVKTSTPTVVNPETDAVETKPATSMIYDLKKYKHSYFISKLTCPSDPLYGKFSSPTGICSLDDDRLLVANFDLDSLLLLDLKGNVQRIYRDLPTPKDVLHYSINPSQAVIATKKEAVILDLEKGTVVVRSKLRGFYPWNIQYSREQQVFAACDPSGERIIHLDKNLNQIGDWSFNDRLQAQPLNQPYEKVYPYAAYYLPDDTAYVLTHRGTRCQLKKYNTINTEITNVFETPSGLLSYSIFVDDARKCLIADKVNHRLVSVDADSTIEQYTCPSMREPYSMTFLSNGTLCVTDWNKSSGTSGGVIIISENDLNSVQ